ncbi:hypothetical protein SLE2022_307810 [Rubroshorea leprosula]
MEDEDEIQSHRSEEHSGSPSQPSPPSNGRISVTVASAPPSVSPPKQNLNALALAVPQSQQPVSKNNGGGGGGREDCWSEGATEVLIDAWGERYLELSRGNLKQKHWKEVADIVSSRDDYSKTPKTDIQCKNRIDTVKKKYKLEKAKMAEGAPPSRWIFFHKLDQLIGPTAKVAVNVSPASGGGGGGGGGSKVPIGIPVGIRSSINHYRSSPIPEPRQQQQQNKRMVMLKNKNQTQNQKVQTRKRGRAETESEEEEEDELSAESMDSLPPPPEKRAKKVQKEVNSEGKEKKWGNSVRELTQAILKFGEAYEQAESAKLQQLVEMEKQRMKFAKELELQRMQFFMKTQLEISQLKHGRRGGNGNSSNHHSNMNKHNHSDCSN